MTEIEKQLPAGKKVRNKRKRESKMSKKEEKRIGTEAEGNRSNGEG